MVIERRPRSPVPRLNTSGPGAQVYQVQTGDSWTTIARDHGLDSGVLIFANFHTLNPAEVNWYLRNYVGCTRPAPDRKNWRFDSTDRPGLISIPTTGAVHFRVPMIDQGRSEICWIACVAMIASYKGRALLGTGSFTGGFDVSRSSVPSSWEGGREDEDQQQSLPAPGWDDRLAALGFVTENPFPSIITPEGAASYIQRILHEHGPWMLWFYLRDLMLPFEKPTDTHAIVITGIDPGTNRVWYNNPWGFADQVTTVGVVAFAMSRLMAGGMNPVAYMP